MSHTALDGIIVAPTTPQYRAGLFDGEGCVTTFRLKKRTMAKYGPKSFESGIVLMLSMGNTDRQLLRVMFDAYGGHVAQQRKVAGRKQTYTWTLRGTGKVVGALKDMLPYLIAKKERAGVAFVLARTYNRHRGVTPMSDEERHWRRELYERLRFLNTRGDAAA